MLQIKGTAAVSLSHVVNIYIRVEDARRELEAKLLLALVAAENGFNCYVGAVTQERILKWGLPPGIFHENNATPTPSSIRSRKALIELGHVITIQDEEHGLMARDYERFAKGRMSSASVEQAAFVFNWGWHDFAYCVDAYPQFSSRFVMTGSPRVDVWKPQFAPVFDRPIAELKRPLDPFLLVVSGAGYLGSARSVGANWELESLMGAEDPRTHRINSKWSFSQLSTEAVHLEKMVETVNLVLGQYPGTQILIRPRPSEDGQLWRSIFRGEDSVSVGNSDSISVAIRKCLAVLQGHSTAALEARIGGVPLFSFASSEHSGFDGFAGLGSVLRTPQDALETIGLLLSGEKVIRQSITPEESNHLDGLLANFKDDSPLAADLMTERWLELAPQIAKRQTIGFGRTWRAHMLAKFQHHVRDRLGQQLAARYPNWKKSVWHASQARKLPIIPASQVCQVVDGFRETTGRFESVEFRFVSPTLVNFLPRSKG